MRRTWFLGAAVASSLLLAGCSAPAATSSSSAAASASAPASTPSSASASAAPSASATPQGSGRVIAGTGYRYTVPKGWGIPKTDVDTSSVDSLAADLDDTDGFADNVNVIVVKTGDVTPAQIEAQGPQQLKSAGATGVAVRDRVTIAGTESAHLTALQKGGTYRVDQFYVIRKGEGYIITFSFSPKLSQADRDATSRSILSTWTWS